MKHKVLKISLLIILLLSIYLIYGITTKDKIKLNYVALGDSLAEGMNSYGEVGYGYSDYIRDYLKDNNKLGTYTKKFAKSGYKTVDLMNDIRNNKTIEENNKSENIKRALRESDIVTISIGANDFFKGLTIDSIYDKLSNNNKSIEELNEISNNVEDLIIEVKKYAKNEIILISYYNPFPSLKTFSLQLDELVKYSNTEYKKICERQNIKFIDIFDIFKNNDEYLPNPYDIHPNTKGYEAISKEIVNEIKKIIE